MLLLKNAELFAPEFRGDRDLLLAGNTIAKVGSSLSFGSSLDVQSYDLSKYRIVPGFIDLHVHLIGGGGEAGPGSRVPELKIQSLVGSGITTAVGTLGTDDLSRSPETLLSKVKAFNHTITAQMYTGSYHFPPDTITNNVKRDIGLIDEVIGVKLAIADHRCSHPSVQELGRLASAARAGGMLSGKPGLVHIHVGSSKSGLSLIRETVQQTEIPRAQFLPTHMGRSKQLLREGIQFTQRSGNIDITAPNDPNEWEVSSTLSDILDDPEMPISNLSISSDANGSLPVFDDEGQLTAMNRSTPKSLPDTVRHLTINQGVPLETALKLVTVNPADRLNLEGKGRIEKGKDADLVVLDRDLNVSSVISRGELVLQQGAPIATDFFSS